MSLDQQARERLSNEHKHDYWDEKTEITFDRFSSNAERSAYVETICEWVLEQVGYDGDEETKIINEAVSFAEGNPEVAKIATRLAVSDSGMLSDSDIETPDDLLWHDIERAVKDDKAGPLFNRLCGVREANTNQLNSLVDAEVSTLARLLNGYLGGEIRETVRRTGGDPNLFGDESWKVSPDIYAGTVFRREGITGDDAAIGTYISDIALNDQTELYPNLAENLVIAHEYGQEWDQPQLVDAIEQETNDFLRDIPQSDITPAEYVQCLEHLAFGGLTVDPTVIETHAELLHSGTTERVTEINAEVNASQLMMNYLSILLTNPDATTGVGVHDNYYTVFSTMARLYKESHDEDPGQFLANVYSMAMSNLSDSYPDPIDDRVKPLLTELQGRATTVAQSDDHDINPGLFLENVYSMAIGHLAKTYPDPTIDRVQAWLAQLQTQATSDACSDDQPHDAGRFIADVYSMAIGNLAETYPDPTIDRVQAWLAQLQTQATSDACSDDHDMDAGQFLANVHSKAILKLAEKHPDPTTDRVQAWLVQLQTCAATAAKSHYHHHSSRLFLANVYSMVISDLVDTYPNPTTDQFRSWLDQLQNCFIKSTPDHVIIPGQFLENVYGMAICQIAKRYPDPATEQAQDCLGAAVTQVKEIARDDSHGSSREDFMMTTFSIAIAHVLEQPQRTAAQWYSALVDQAVGTFDVDTIPQFCRALERAHKQYGRDLAKMHVQFSTTVLSLSTGDTGQLGTNHDDRVARVSAVLAATTYLIWQQTGLDGEYIQHLITAVEDVEQAAPSLYADIVSQTNYRLSETHEI
jgi:hypothetical protein